MYGPTVVMTTLAAEAMSRSEPGFSTSASSSGRSSPSFSSLALLRPASATRASPALATRYSAVSAPVNPVAPKRTTSYGRSFTTAGACHSFTVEHLDLIIFGLLLAVTALAVAARWLDVPYPILLVLGGLGLGYVPGIPEIHLGPDLVLLIFLPPLLYGAAFFTSLRDLRANAKTIGVLAIPLVVTTMVAVAALAHFVIGLDWSVAFVLGAVVSPTDAVAPAATLREVDAPRRVISIIEGENLTNDWTALVLYRIAVGAVVGGSFSLWDAGLRFFVNGLGGLAIGLAVGFVIRELRRRIDDPPTELTISLLTAYAAYLPAEELGVSGVIAAVTVGIYMGWYTPELTTPTTRIQVTAVWTILTFLLNAVLFLLVGLQLPAVLDEISGRSAGELALWAGLVSGGVIVVRLGWEFTVPQAIRLVGRRVGQLAQRLDAKQRLIVGWSGMRG